MLRAVIGLLALFAALVTYATNLVPLTGKFTVDYSCVDEPNQPCGDNHPFKASITLTNQTSEPISDWRLYFNSVRPLIEVQGATIVLQTINHRQYQATGDYYILAGAGSNQTIAPGATITLNITGQYWIRHITDAPQGYFFTAKNYSEPVIVPVINQLLPWQPKPGQDDYQKNINHLATSIEGNNPDDTIPLYDTNIVPLPLSINSDFAYFQITPTTKIEVQAGNIDAFAAAEFFAAAIAPALGYELRVTYSSTNKPSFRNIYFTSQAADVALGDEGYSLNVNLLWVVVRAKSAAGFFYAGQTLRQLMPPAIYSHDQQKASWAIKSVHIKDKPRFAYRGMHLDVARHFVSADLVKRFIDLMAMHKLNVFHWHLTDDEGWRVQINQYPELTAIGAWRGYDEVLTPTLGSGPNRYGGYYTQAEISDIINYANERHVTIMPEIDMPGHARAMIKSLPNLLVDPDDQSEYTSVQGYHDNVLSPCLDSTYTVIDKIIGEVAALFPGDYIHIGGDEVPKGAWVKSPKCIALMQQQGLATIDELENYFFRRLQSILAKYNKKMAGWEEVINGDDKQPLNAETRVYAWTGVAGGIKAAEKGYQVVMTPAQFLYFDLAYSADPFEPGYYWAGFVDTFQAYSYSPINVDMSPAVIRNIQGVQGALWSEVLTSPQRLDYMAYPKMLALAEIAWTDKNRRNWGNFARRLGMAHLQRLDWYGVDYRLPLPGIGPAFLGVKANVAFAGLTLRYTKDGGEPDMQSPEYRGWIQTSEPNNVNMRSFNNKGRASRTATLMNN